MGGDSPNSATGEYGARGGEGSDENNTSGTGDPRGPPQDYRRVDSHWGWLRESLSMHR